MQTKMEENIKKLDFSNFTIIETKYKHGFV